MEIFTKRNLVVDALATAILITIVIHPDSRSYIIQKACEVANVRDVAVTSLKEWATGFTLPDISGTARTPVKRLKYDVRSIRVNNFAIPSSKLVNSDSAITFSISGASAVVRGNWSYKYFIIKGSGTFDLNFRAIDASLTFHAGIEKSWRFTLSTSEADCFVNVVIVKLKLYGRGSWLYNRFSKRIARQIRKAANKEICGEIVKPVNLYLEQVSNTYKDRFVAAVFTCISLYILVIIGINLCLSGLFYMSEK